ncbi:MAG: serine hydrolase domain-containing protein, partial [Saprospiraceae bacterium]
SASWETAGPAELNWDTTQIPALISLLDQGGTRGFLLLQDGKIALEHYAGNGLVFNQPFNRDSRWYWASASKTLTAAAVGEAQADGLLDINAPSSTYLGAGWSGMTPERENAITVRHHLTMTTGLDYRVADQNSTAVADLDYLAEPGTLWYYYNAPYSLLKDVVAGATGETFDDYFDRKIAAPIGITGSWEDVGGSNMYFSSPRSMARFGLLVLNDGRWQNTPVLNPDFLRASTTTSQQLNPSYGYLWWLNGKESFRLPGTTLSFNDNIIPNAPADMVCGLGRNSQYVCVIPSKNMVLVRMGDDPDESPVPLTFLNDICGVLNNIIR